MESKAILDSQISASSELNGSTPANHSRLKYTAGIAWCALTSDSSPYLQIDLRTLHIICAVSTQGNAKSTDWVKTFIIQTSTDGTTWTDYKDFGQVKVSCCSHYLPCIRTDLNLLIAAQSEGKTELSYVICRLLQKKKKCHG